MFEPLTRAQLADIAELQLEGLATLAGGRGITLSWTEEVPERLAELGFDPSFGARPLARVIVRHLKDPLADQILSGALTEGHHVRIEWEEEAFQFVVVPKGIQQSA